LQPATANIDINATAKAVQDRFMRLLHRFD
jgi:hypothetical protein